MNAAVQIVRYRVHDGARQNMYVMRTFLAAAVPQVEHKIAEEAQVAEEGERGGSEREQMGQRIEVGTCAQHQLSQRGAWCLAPRSWRR